MTDMRMFSADNHDPCDGRCTAEQGSVTWNTAPSLKPLRDGTAVRTIARNPVDYASAPQPSVAGHISVAGGTSDAVKMIDITDAVTAAPS